MKLYGVKLYGVKLYGVKLYGVKLYGVKLRRADWLGGQNPESGARIPEDQTITLLNCGYSRQHRVSPTIFTQRSKRQSSEFTARFSPRLNSGFASEPHLPPVAISKQLGAENLFVDSLLTLFYRNGVFNITRLIAAAIFGERDLEGSKW